MPREYTPTGSGRHRPTAASWRRSAPDDAAAPAHAVAGASLAAVLGARACPGAGSELSSRHAFGRAGACTGGGIRGTSKPRAFALVSEHVAVGGGPLLAELGRDAADAAMDCFALAAHCKARVCLAHNSHGLQTPHAPHRGSHLEVGDALPEQLELTHAKGRVILVLHTCFHACRVPSLLLHSCAAACTTASACTHGHNCQCHANVDSYFHQGGGQLGQWALATRIEIRQPVAIPNSSPCDEHGSHHRSAGMCDILVSLFKGLPAHRYQI